MLNALISDAVATSQAPDSVCRFNRQARDLWRAADEAAARVKLTFTEHLPMPERRPPPSGSWKTLLASMMVNGRGWPTGPIELCTSPDGGLSISGRWRRTRLSSWR